MIWSKQQEYLVRGQMDVCPGTGNGETKSSMEEKAAQKACAEMEADYGRKYSDVCTGKRALR